MAPPSSVRRAERAAATSPPVGTGGFSARDVADPGRSQVWPHDASLRDTTKLHGVLEFGGEGDPIRASWTAYDLPLMMAAGVSGGIHGPIVDLWPLYGKEALVMLSDDEENCSDGWGSGCGSSPTTLRGGLVMWHVRTLRCKTFREENLVTKKPKSRDAIFGCMARVALWHPTERYCLKSS